MTTAIPPRRRVRPWWVVPLVVGLALAAGTAAAGFVVLHGTGSATGVQNGSVFLTDWQQTGVLPGATPNPVPLLVGLTVTAPVRLPAATTALVLDAAVAGHEALEWSFSESVGMPSNKEVEIAFSLHYDVGVAVHSVTLTAFVETQAVAITAALTFTLYWDSGATTGVSFTAEEQISQACSAVGTCP